MSLEERINKIEERNFIIPSTSNWFYSFNSIAKYYKEILEKKDKVINIYNFII